MSLDYEATLRPMVKTVAKQVSYRFPRSVLTEDIEQDLWVWAYRNKKSVTKKIESSPEGWIEQVASTMRKQAFSFGSDEIKAVEGTYGEDGYKYSLNEIRTLIPDIFNYEDWQSFGSFGDGQPKSKSQANTTGDRITSLIDVKDKLANLKDEHYNVLVWRYKFGYSNADIAIEYESSEDAARKRVERALKALQKLLGHNPQQEYTGRRSVRSNAAWRAASENYYQEN